MPREKDGIRIVDRMNVEMCISIQRNSHQQSEFGYAEKIINASIPEAFKEFKDSDWTVNGCD